MELRHNLPHDADHADHAGHAAPGAAAGAGERGTSGPPRNRFEAYVRLARPKQLVKNVLVVAAPGAAGVLTHGDALFKTIVAFVCFCLAASGTYYINDA